MQFYMPECRYDIYCAKYSIRRISDITAIRQTLARKKLQDKQKFQAYFKEVKKYILLDFKVKRKKKERREGKKTTARK